MHITGIILLRLRHLGILEAILQELLDCTPSFRPWGSFQSNTSSENKENSGIIRRPASTKILKGGGNTVCRPNDCENLQTAARRSTLNQRKIINSTRMLSDDDESTVGRNMNVTNGTPSKFTDVADLRPYMRELELDVLRILRYGEIPCQLFDTNLQEKDGADTIKLRSLIL
ncbi:hypothetical protein BC937DRAFT_93738 [Endogone sp. FLAS-F59071]|nr:hypothetical protein BC937DRAFT_93738 [Endogone sp. FLAS-F59071]|eukprot:RUS21066.1 hypothetical protein BC937DRAFT_93738 [Endogone sp. FLAS-F59071]